LLFPVYIKAQIPLTNGAVYYQDFDGLGTGHVTTTNLNNHSPTLLGWWFHETGNNANTQMTAGNGSSNAGDTYNFGATNASNRKIGCLQSGNLLSRFGAMFTNSSLSTITSISIAYTGVTWRVGATGRVDRLDFQYSTNATWVGDPGATWVDFDALDYTNNAATSIGGGSELQTRAISNIITGLSIQNGGRIWIRWLDWDAAGADDGMGIDGLRLVPIGEAPCVPTGSLTLVQQTNHYEKFSNGGDIFNSGGAQMGMWANLGAEQVVAWRTFRTDGSGGGAVRRLQPGDRFRITINGPNPNGRVGVSINDGAATGSWNNRTNNTRGFIEVQGGGFNDYYVTHAGGTPSWSGVRPNSTDQTIVFDILSSHEFTANIEGQTPKYDLTMLNNPSFDSRVDGFSLFLQDDAGDITWKQPTMVTNLGFILLGADNGTRNIIGKITDSTDPVCTNTVVPNLLRKAGTGTITLQHTTNTYSMGTRIEGGTLAVFHDGSLGAVPGSAVPTNIIIFGNATLRATNTFTLSANRGIFLGHTNGPTIEVDAGMTLTYSGILGGDADWNKRGTGVLALAGTASTNKGRVSIQAGTLRIKGDGSLGAVPTTPSEKINIWSTGTLEADATFTLNANRRIELGSVNGPRLSVTAGNTLTYGGQISGSANWFKEGAGALTLTGVLGSASGTLIINAGVVNFNGTNTSQAIGVTTNGYLYGNGSVGSLIITGQVSAGAASNTVGNLRATSVTLASNGVLQVNFSAMTGAAGTDWDVITVAGGAGTYTVTAVDGSDFIIALKGNPTFDNTQGYTNIIVDAGTASGFDPNKFTINTAEFSPPLGGGSFSVDAAGGDLRLIFTPAAAATPDILVLGTNGAVIANNDSTPSAADGTDFGAVLWSGSYAVTNIFSITNAGSAALTITGVTTNSGMGAAGDFIVLSFPTTVGPGARSNLVIAFDPMASGTRTAAVVIANNDSSKNPYIFAVSGVGTAPTGTIIYDGFAASSGTLNGGSGGTGWSNNWTLGGDPYADYTPTSFPLSNSCYATTSGNKVVFYGDVDGRWISATRTFAQPFTNGTVYFSWIQNYAFNGINKYAGLRLMQDSTEKAFIGKVSSANKALGIADSSVNATSSFNLENGVGQDYVIVAKYDFATRELSAVAYRIGSDVIAEEPKGYWHVSTTQNVGHITHLSGVRLACGAGPGVQIGYVYYDEIRVGTNWYEVTRRDGLAQASAMAAGPVPRLLYVGTNYNPALNPQGSIADITVTDAMLANTNDPIDIAVLWSNSFGVFLTNSNGSLNIGSRVGRVNPNFDPVVLAGTSTQFQSFGFDAAFTNRIGINGAVTVTTFQHQAFTLTNTTFNDTFFITLSAENNNMGGGTVPAPNGADAIPAWRALTVNTALQFYVQDDDPNDPEIFEFTINGVGGSGQSNLLPGAIAIIGVNGAGAATDRFSFVTLAPFPAGTRFDFTDCGWDANSNKWYNLLEFHTNAWVASGNIDVGTVVELRLDNINAAGDQVVIYQYDGTLNPTSDPDNVRFIYAVNLGPGWFTNLFYPGGGTNNQNSMLYRGLTNGVNAVSVPISGAANARYIGPTTGTASYILSQISNSNNWQSFASGYIDLTNYSFSITGPGDFDWETPELSDAQVLAGGYRVTNVARDLDSGIIATNKPYGHAPYFTLSNTNGQIVVSNQFAVNFADGTKTPITNRMTAPPGIYERITLGIGEALVAVADNDNDRPLDTRFKTNKISVLVYDDDPHAPIVGTNAVRLLLGASALPATNRIEAIAVWNFNDTNALATPSYGAGQMNNTITSTNNFAGSTVNLYESDPAGRDFAVVGVGNIGRSISFVIDMTGRKDLVVSFAAQRSPAGYNSNTIAYAVGTGAFVTVESGWSPATNYALKTVDLSAYPEINGAASVTFRITFGTNAVTGAGNNRFDNFQFNADYITYYEVSDGLLATVGSTNPLRFSFNAYDSYSGLKRGTANDGTNMTVWIEGLATNNTANYVASLSSSSTTNAAATSVWEFASAISYAQIGDLYADGKSNRFIRANLADADNDRPHDTAWFSNALFGVWRVIDDDTSTPVVADLNYANAAARPFMVLTNGGTFASGEKARSLDRRTGTGSNTVWTLTDGDLAASGSIGLQFAFGARDVHSGVGRGNSGTTNTVMSFSLGDVIVGNFSNYNASLSTLQTTTNQVLTNVWSFGAGSFSSSFIGTLMATNIGVNPLATTTRAVRVTIPDTDDDRPDDRATLYAAQVGLIRIADDDARGPLIASAIADGTTGNEQNYIETFEPALGWTNTLSFSGSWTNTVSNGTYIASGNVLWGSLNPKVSGTRRIGLLTNSAMTHTWLQLPPVTDPGTFTVFAGRFGGEDPSNDVPVSLERLVGSTWSNLGTHMVSALNPEFEMLSWNVNVDGVVTLRLVRASTTGVQVYMDDINITPNPEWVSTNQLTVRWTEAVDDFSGVDEYRLVMPAIGTTTPTATNAGSGFAFGVTSHTASIIGQQGVLTGFLFAIDNDNDRPNDRAMGNLKPIVVRVDTNPPPPAQNLRATDATSGFLFDPTIDESSEIKVEWRPGGTNEAQAAGWRQSDSVALSPWDSYVIRYYEVSDTNGTPSPNAVTVTISRTTPGWSNVLNNWAFTNLVLSNLQFDAYYRIEIQGRDLAGNIGIVTSVIGNTDRFIVTQGLTRAGGGLAMRWTGPTNETVFRDYDVLFVDAPQGFRNVLSNQWQWMAHTNRPRLEDYGGTNRVMPGALTGTTYRLYRVARQGRWTTNQNPRVASAEIYAAKAIRLHPGENWYSLFSFPDPATTNEMESTVAYVFGTNTLPAGTTYDNSTRISWFGHTPAPTNRGSVATSIVWLSSSSGWQYWLGGSGNANEKRVPLGQGFLIELPTNAAPTNLVLVGRVPTQALVRTIAAPVSTNQPEFHILSHQMTERIVFSNFIKQFSGFAGGPYPVFADEIRILNNASSNGVSFGSLRQPRMRIWLSTQAAHSNAPWRLTTSGYPSAMTQIIEPDDAVIVVRRKATTVVWTNAPTYSAPNKNMSP
jgi:hypothetical protein